MSNLVKTENGKYKLATKDQFLKDFTIKQCMLKFVKVKSPVLAFQTQAPTLASVKVKFGDDYMLAYIEMWIDNLNDFVNTARKMTPGQIQETALFIYQDYHYLNIADLNLVFGRMKRGEFGKLYESIDGMKILEYFRIYGSERADKIEQMSINSDAKYKQDDFKRTSDTSDIKTAFKRANAFQLIENSKKNK